MSPHVLVVDDNPDGLLVRRALLTEAGCRVQIAGNAEEGLKLFKSTSFDVVVTDYRMPGMNGAELIQEIRGVNPEARIILLSAFVDPLGLTEDNTGADVVLEKSAQEPRHLVRWVKRLNGQTAQRKSPGRSRRGGGSRPAAAS